MESSKWQPVGAAALAIVACFVFMEAQNVSAAPKEDGVAKVSTFDSIADRVFGPDEIPPVPKLPEDQVLIRFCMNWGSKGYYQQVGQLLQTRATTPLKVVPAEFPISKRIQALQSVFQVLTLGLMVCLFAYDKILPDSWRENKAGTFLFIWIGSSMVSSMLTKSNAFEIYKGAGGSAEPELIWSSLAKERLPSMGDLVDNFARVGIEIIPPRAK